MFIYCYIDESGEDYLFSAHGFAIIDLPQAVKRAIVQAAKNMETLTPRYSKEEFARRGDEIYTRNISPQMKRGDEGKFVVFDIDTGDFEIDKDELAASDRLLARKSDAQMWVTRIGSRYARCFR